MFHARSLHLLRYWFRLIPNVLLAPNVQRSLHFVFASFSLLNLPIEFSRKRRISTIAYILKIAAAARSGTLFRTSPWNACSRHAPDIEIY
jgi:hypothetical protein